MTTERPHRFILYCQASLCSARMVVRQQQVTKHLRHRNLWHVSLLCPFTTHCRHSPQTSLPALRSRVERMDLTYRWIWSILLLWLAVTGRLIRATPPPDEMDALLEELLKDVPETAGPSSSHNLAPVEPHLITDRSWNELFHTTYSEHHNRVPVSNLRERAPTSVSLAWLGSMWLILSRKSSLTPVSCMIWYLCCTSVPRTSEDFC